MKKSEHAACLAAAQAELDRLRAIVPEPDELATVLPGRQPQYERTWYINSAMQSGHTTDYYDPTDNSLYLCGNYFSSHEQATRYAEALSTLLLMRRQPGQVDPSRERHEVVAVCGEYVAITGVLIPYNTGLQRFMFPAFTPGYAQAAVDAIGAERIVRTAKWLAG